jgi:Holliday junction resolvase-like predicted endonuclease
MNDKDWKKTREEGEWAEDIVANYLQDKGYTIIQFNPAKNGEYDILVEKDKQIYIEVKLDQSDLARTINIEFMSSGTASGIKKTKADIYICLQPQINELMYMNVKDIKDAIKEQMLSRTITISGDGSYNSLARFYNMNKDDIKNKKTTIDWKKYENFTNQNGRPKLSRPEKLKHL